MDKGERAMIDCVDYYNGTCNSLTHMCAECPDRKMKEKIDERDSTVEIRGTKITFVNSDDEKIIDNEIKPHVYMPNYQAMGDCRVCGHDADKPWHLFGRRAVMFGEYCKCEKPLIKCDNRGCRCVACGLPENKALPQEQPMKKSLTFEDLRFANVQRNQEWDPDNKISGAFRGLEFSGEVGEFIEAVQDQLVNLAIKTGTICNMTKKMERERLGLKGSRVSLIEIAKEFADAQITLDLLAMHFSIDIAESVAMVFNAKSDEHGFKTHIGEEGVSGMPNVMTDDDDFPEQVDDPSLPESESFHGIGRGD